MAGLFRSSKATSANPAAVELRVQTSLQGKAKPIGAGQNRVAGNLIWYGDFTASPASNSSSGGGKGGAVTGVFGKGNTASGYNYSASVMISLGEGPMAAWTTVYANNAIDFIAPPSSQVLNDLALLGITPTYGNTYGFGVIAGNYGQSPWSYLTSNHPSQALSYGGEMVMAVANLALGSSPAMPNFSFEIVWAINSDVPGFGYDANPVDWITNFLSNSDWGAGFPAALIGSSSQFQTFCRAASLLISPVVTDQVQAQSHLNDLMKATASDFRWSSGQLTIQPYAEGSLSGNGYTFTPNITPVYNLTPNDFLANQGSLGQSTPTEKTTIAFSRKDPTQILNKVQVEYLDRSNIYNPVTIYNSDDASIVASKRLRLSDLRAHHFFCNAVAASTSCALQLHREQVVNQYQFTLPPQFILLDVMDIVTITEPNMGLAAQPVRIIEIQENSDRSLTFTAEEFLGTVTAPLYARQKAIGTGANTNADPGTINAPMFFEPSDAQGNGLALWVGVSGANPALWGGCFVWVSYDGLNYSEIGVINGSARQGVLGTSLPSITAAIGAATIDNTNTPSVNLTESNGALISVSAADFQALNTACLVDNEVIGYQNVTLTGANTYTLGPLVRGAYGSTIASHLAGAPFTRLDNQIFQFPYNQSRVGTTLYFKFQGFNKYGGGLQQLSNLSPYTYIITGAALASALPNPTNLRAFFQSGAMNISWDEVTDFRPVLYEIRKGATWTSAVKVTTQAHPPFIAVGDDTYWISAVSTPTSGITVYSASPVALAISGSLLTTNVVHVYDEQATGWTGSVSNGLAVSGTGASAYLILGGGGNILSDGDFLHTPDIVNYGGITASGVYTIPASHIVDAGYVTNCLVGATFVGAGAPVGQSLLQIADFLNYADILGAASSQYVDVHVEIQTSQVSPASWSSWQKLTPGTYSARMFNFRLVLASSNPQTLVYATKFKITVSAPGRLDHYLNQTVPSGGLAIVFQPDGAALAGAFNAGPNGAALPNVSVNWQATTGDTYVISAFSLSGLTITFYNSVGTAVSRSGVNILVEGY